MRFKKAILCGCTGKTNFSGFVQTMHFVEKQHKLTLKALILCKIGNSLGWDLFNILTKFTDCYILE